MWCTLVYVATTRGDLIRRTLLYLRTVSTALESRVGSRSRRDHFHPRATPRDARRGWVVRGLLCAQWRHRPCPISTESIARVGFLKLFKCSRQTLMLKCALVRPVGVLARSGPHHLVRLARATGTPSCRSSLGFALPLGSTLVPASQNDARNADGRGAPRGPLTEALSHSKAANLGSPGGARRIAGRARHSRAVHIVERRK